MELLDVSPEFALFDPAVDATGIEVGGIVEFMDPIKIEETVSILTTYVTIGSNYYC